MRKFAGSIYFALFLAVSLMVSSVTAQSDDGLSLSGRHFELIASAVAEAKSHGHEISSYLITLSRIENRFIVEFVDPNRPEGIRGSSPNMQEFLVEIDSDSNILRTTYMR